MRTIEQRLERLERTNHRYRWIIGGLACLMLLLIGVGAGKQQDGGKLVLDELVIRDEEGRKRIRLNGSLMVLLDANGKKRIVAETLPDGEASINHFDANEKVRILAVTLPDGRAHIFHDAVSGP